MGTFSVHRSIFTVFQHYVKKWQTSLLSLAAQRGAKANIIHTMYVRGVLYLYTCIW